MQTRVHIRPNFVRRCIVIAAASTVLFAAVGCQNSVSNQKTQREEATNQWNSARASVLYGLARDQYQTGNYDKCRQTISEALRMQPTNAKLHILAGKLAIEQGQLETADREFAEARKDDPKDAEADYFGGVVCQRWQKAQAAFDFYDTASTKAPTEISYVLAKAEMLVAMDRQPEALAMLQDKVLFFEHSAAIRDAVGELLIQQKRMPEAVEMLREASILGTDDQQIREHLAMAMFYNKQYREASELFTRLMKEPSNQQRPELFLAQGECQMQLHKFAEARGCFESAAQLSPSNCQAMTSLAKAAIQLNDLHRADLALRKANALDPENAEVQLLTGYLYVRENKMSDALAAFQRASSLDHSDTVSLCMIGYVLEKTGKSQQAMEYYGKALHMKPNDPMATQMMASVDMNE